MRYSLNIKMKNIYYFILFIFFSELSTNIVFAQDSILFSLPNGVSTHLILENSGVLPFDLQTKFPTIKAYKARNIFFPKTDFRIQNFNGQWEIYMIKGDSITKFLKNKEGIWDKEIQDEFNEELNCFTNPKTKEKELSKSSYSLPDDSLRIYRLALSTTGEFSDFHGGNMPKVFSVLVGMVNLINAVFERDLGIRFTLVNQSDDLIFQYANADPFTQGNESSQNQQLLDRLIGNDYYDIGHVVGGLKSVSIGKIGSICQKGEKGMGVSTSLIPEGISFIFDYFSHELAHQLGGNHTFNSIICNNQRNPQTAWEPGSGISILGYPGLCASDNLASHVLPHFHSGSTEEIINLLLSKEYKNCGEKLPFKRNHKGVVDLIDYNLPRNTPFLLNPNMDNFGEWFSWESMDLGNALPINDIKGSSPNISMTALKNKAIRYFPALDSLVKSTFEPGVILADYGRNINLRLTRRDSLKIDWHSFSLRVNSNAGPLTVILPKEDLINEGDLPVLVEWNPANTFLPPVDADKVDIFLVDIFNPDSIIYLQRNIPNLGRISIYLPLHLPSSTYKIGVKGANKLFFNISQGKIKFQKKEAVFLNPMFNKPLFTCGNEINFNWDLSTLPKTFFPLSLKLKEIPGWKFTWNDKVLIEPENISLGAFSLPDRPIIPIYGTTLQITLSNKEFNFPIEWVAYPKKEIKIENITPVQKAEIFELNPLFSWKSDAKSDWYQVEISDHATFDFLLDSMVTTENATFSNLKFESGKQYFWRVKYVNILCGKVNSEVFSFTVANSICKGWISIDSIRLNQIPFRQSNLILEQKGTLTDISELWVSLNISNWEQVKIYVKSPAGKKIQLDFPFNCLKTSQWQYLKFTKNNTTVRPCLIGDTLVIPDFYKLTELKGELINGLWQLIFEGVNQVGTIGNWGIKGCVIDKITGLNNLNLDKPLTQIFPNPSSEMSVNMIFQKNEEAKIILWDILGKKMGEWKKDPFYKKLSITDLDIPNGIYFWEISYDNLNRETHKWIIH